MPDRGPTATPTPVPPVVRVSDALRITAAARLVGEQTSDPLDAANRFLASARAMKIDVSRMWATLDPDAENVRQVCLAVVGPGRTAMLFVSGPPGKGTSWISAVRKRNISETPEAQAERIAVINAACEEMANLPGSGGSSTRGIVLAQALLEARERPVISALTAAGFLQLGDLAYKRRELPTAVMPKDFEQGQHIEWPPGIQVESLAGLLKRGISRAEADRLFAVALERTYIDTLDCPELCGLREVTDVLESHRAVGTHDPSLWWLVSDEYGPQGCLLFSVCVEQDSIELVYLGLSPSVRGKGLGWSLLMHGLYRLYDTAIRGAPVANHPCVLGTGGITCAVDTRNTPAVRLYRRAAFQRFAVRVPMVKRLAPR